MSSRPRLGDLLVAARIIDDAQLADALGRQKELGLRLGETLVALGAVTELQVAQTLSHQLSIPWVNLRHVDFSRELLNLVPAELAERARLVPIYVRKVRASGEVLFVATDDPLNEPALLEVAAVVGLPIKPMVASALDLREALRVYYGRVVPAPRLAASARESEDAVELSDLEIELDPSSLVPSVAPPAARADAPDAARGDGARPRPSPRDDAQAAPREPAPRASEEPADEPTEEVADERIDARPPPSARSKPRMLTLTLLDGTKVSLPTPSASAEGGEGEAPSGLTTRDLIRALLLAAEGEDVSSVLPNAAWQPLFAALLSLLLKKGLVADWEFLDEWAKVERVQQRRRARR